MNQNILLEAALQEIYLKYSVEVGCGSYESKIIAQHKLSVLDEVRAKANIDLPLYPSITMPDIGDGPQC